MYCYFPVIRLVNFVYNVGYPGDSSCTVQYMYLAERIVGSYKINVEVHSFHEDACQCTRFNL